MPRVWTRTRTGASGRVGGRASPGPRTSRNEPDSATFLIRRAHALDPRRAHGSRTRSSPFVDARVARDQRPGRLRLRHGRRRRDPPLPRLLIAALAGAARAHDDARRTWRRPLVLPDGATVQLGGASTVPHGRSGPVPLATRCGVPARERAAGVALRVSAASSIEKRMSMPHLQNTVHVSYELLGRGRRPPRARALVHFRPHDGRARRTRRWAPTRSRSMDDRYEVTRRRLSAAPRMHVDGDATRRSPSTEANARRPLPRRARFADTTRWASFRAPAFSGRRSRPDEERRARRLDRERGRRSARSRRSDARASRARAADAACSSRGRRPRASGVGGELVLAADQFIITPAGRIEDAARAHAAGDEVRTVIAGYHWFTDWGRDTMISLEGLTL